jgi:phosphoribosyl-ATP pyrophosphohydrolase
MTDHFGYHINIINKGIIGECSKIIEEIEEVIDAEKQKSKIMILVELSDLLGAILLYIQKYELNIDVEFVSDKNTNIDKFINSSVLLKTAKNLEQKIKSDTERNVETIIKHLNSYLLNNFTDFSFLDLYTMSNITERAFKNGYR